MTELDKMEALGREIGHLIGAAIESSGIPAGFSLHLWGMGEQKFATYLSNCDRGDMIKALREMLGVLEGGKDQPAGLGRIVKDFESHGTN